MTQEDFEAMFNAYDMMNLHYIPVSYLIDGLKAIGVPNPDQLVQTKYKEVVEEGQVNKVTFLYVMEEEHKRKGFSN